MQKLPWWELLAEAAVVLAGTLLTYWIVARAPWMTRPSAALTAGAALLLSSTVILYAHYSRRAPGGPPSLEEALTEAQRSAPYAMGGTAVAVLAAVCGLVGLYRFYEGDLLVGVLSAAASAGLTALAVWILKRGLPRQESRARPVPTVEERAATVQRWMKYTMAGGTVALLAGVCGFVALYRLSEGDFLVGVLSAAASAGLALLALWILKRGLPR